MLFRSRGLCPPALSEAAIATMGALNKEASAAMVEVGASAATDVTGFGLLGHLRNFGVGVVVEAGAVPFLDGVRELTARDLFPDGSRRNHASLAEDVDWGGLELVEQMLLSDSQTSGGLLVAIPPAAVARFMDLCPAAARIGEVSGDGRLRVRP